MKITKEYLKRVIKEELEETSHMEEAGGVSDPGDAADAAEKIFAAMSAAKYLQGPQADQVKEMLSQAHNMVKGMMSKVGAAPGTGASINPRPARDSIKFTGSRG